MSKTSRFREPFNKQHRKRAQALMKSSPHHLYDIDWSLPSQLNWKKSLLLTYQILGLLVNTFPVDGKYPVLSKLNLKILIQMQLSQKWNTFSQFVAAFLQSKLNFEYFEKKYDPSRFSISEVTDSENVVRQYLKSPISEDPSTSNMVNVSKHCWTLHPSTSIILIDQFQGNWVGKSFSYWHAKYWDCVLTNWLPMTSILFLIETV